MNYLKLIVLALILLVASSYLGAEMPPWQWAKGTGAVHTDAGEAIAIDSDGYIYSTGRFCDTVDFGSISLTAAGPEDIYVAKHDANGNFLWVRRAGGTSSDIGRDIAIDNEGNVYITGHFSETADFGPTSFTCYGRTDIFVAKLDTNGNWLWAQRGYGPGEDASYGIALDEFANVYLTGHFAGTISFGDTSLTASGSTDIFVAQLSTNGFWQWAQKAGGITRDGGRDIAVDHLGFVYVSGVFFHLCDFGSISLATGYDEDVFVACMDSAGNWIWAKQAGGSSSDSGHRLTVDNMGHIFLAGVFGGTATFGTIELTSSGPYDIYVAKLDIYGHWLWAVRGGGTGEESVNGLCTDSDGHCYLTGQFSATSSFGGTSLTSSGSNDIYVAKLDFSGNWLWAGRAGGELNDCGNGIVVNDFGNIYVNGFYSDNADFGTHDLSGSGYWDIFIAKIGTGVGNNDDLLALPLAGASLKASPNPFNGSISLSLATGTNEPLRLGTASLIIYDLKGRKVRNLQSPSSTEFNVMWDGRDDSNQACPSGVYFAKLYANGQSICTRKLSLVK